MPEPEELSVPAYLEARTRAEEAVVRAAFDDLRARVRADVKPPPARALVSRARRQQVRTARRRVVLAAAAAVVLLGTAATVVRFSAGPDGGTTTVAASTPAGTASAAPASPSAPTASRTTAPPEVVPSQPVATRTVVVTVAPTPSRTPAAATSTRPQATGSPSGPPGTAAPSTPPAPTAEVTVYLWKGSGYPDCTDQVAVRRTVPGTGGWAAAVGAALAGVTADEQAAGYASPFGPGVDAAVDEAAHRVDFASTAGFDGVPLLCRGSVESVVSRTATDAGHSAELLLGGSGLRWLNWKIGLG